MSEAGLIWCPFPDAAQASEALAQLLDARLVACGNIAPEILSAFRWEGERDEAQECGLLLKTTAARLDPAMAKLEELHPYDRPAITGWTASTTAGTLAWLEAETRDA